MTAAHRRARFAINVVLNLTFLAFIGAVWLVWNLVSSLPIFSN